MKNCVLALSLLVSLGICESLALSPKPKANSAQNQQAEDFLPASQEATEQSVLPEEPALVEPGPETLPDAGNLLVQPLPEPEATPTDATQDELRKKAEAFHAAKTEAEEQPALIGLRNEASAAKTERRKRALLNEYYQGIATYLSRKSPVFKDDAEAWAYAKRMRLQQSRTDPQYVAPTPPPSLVANPAVATPTPKKKRAGGLPFFGN